MIALYMFSIFSGQIFNVLVDHRISFDADIYLLSYQDREAPDLCIISGSSSYLRYIIFKIYINVHIHKFASKMYSD
jgi:hypothetical protein